ncbi:MAG: DNA-binding response regulator [Actinobacteria bacterium]|uniref:Unannotated protein n=1 Tax=freshwater metagenome TaxID=449393 RepID=A0A6J6NRY4_9ZZZZ|nr:response regulator [Actinomycetota bacterium]MSY51372.1 response regulator [Actinomycetota bacterium]MSY87890.1 response regulator [Actinomycetota bacterium]MTA50106.1 response regulator [Actinomycetota bacterium]NBP91217.1 DNA-binding response regulator [Actinomycetota bacterium]
MENLRVVLVEDDDFTRGLLSTSLTSQGLIIAGAADNASAGLKLILDLQPDVALLDLNLGKGPNGLDLAVTVRQRAPHVGIVMLTSIEDPRLLGPNLSQAPVGVEFLIKREMGDIEKVVTALQNAKRAASTPTGHRIRPAGVPRVKEFTDSQIETMRLVSLGMTNAQIAGRRGVSEKSVEQMISRIFGQLSMPLIPAGQNQRVAISRLYYRLTGGAPSHDAD